ncbi:MAG: DUF2608 domain-containing protein [Xanthomonadales bacterium]|nr:DUF2608 domain-containing protein [Xanthomonadales bacterium]
MPKSHSIGLACTALTAMLLAACSSVEIRSNWAETPDVGDFVNDALTHADRLGSNRILVVFDLDNTLLAMEQGLGSDQWYEWQKAAAAADRCDPRVVADRLAVQGALYYASAMRPTQTEAPALLRALQEAGIRVIALTSRGTGFRLQTFRELRRNGYDFRRTALRPRAGWPDDFLPDNGLRPVRYEDGVFLTTGQHKGAMLLDLLRRTETSMPDVIFMLDDKQDNLDAIHESFAPLGVRVRTWRYTGEDENVAQFDADESDTLWQSVAPALKDIEAAFGPDHYSLDGALEKNGC